MEPVPQKRGYVKEVNEYITSGKCNHNHTHKEVLLESLTEVTKCSICGEIID